MQVNDTTSDGGTRSAAKRSAHPWGGSGTARPCRAGYDRVIAFLNLSISQKVLVRVILSLSLYFVATPSQAQTADKIAGEIISTCLKNVSASTSIREVFLNKGYVFPEMGSLEQAATILAYESRLKKYSKPQTAPDPRDYPVEIVSVRKSIATWNKTSFQTFLVHPKFHNFVLEFSEKPKRRCGFVYTGEIPLSESILNVTKEDIVLRVGTPLVSKWLFQPNESMVPSIFVLQLVQPRDPTVDLGGTTQVWHWFIAE
jgi:hypothetical protein